MNEDVNIATGLYTREYSLHNNGAIDYRTARQIIDSRQNDYGNTVVDTTPHPLFYWYDEKGKGAFTMWIDPEGQGCQCDIVPYTALAGDVGRLAAGTRRSRPIWDRSSAAVLSRFAPGVHHAGLCRHGVAPVGQGFTPASLGASSLLPRILTPSTPGMMATCGQVFAGPGSHLTGIREDLCESRSRCSYSVPWQRRPTHRTRPTWTAHGS